MKVIGKFNTNLVDKRNHGHITFTVENYRHVMQLEELEQDEYYAMEIKKRKSKRSINQNAFMWALLHQLEKASDQDMMSWYIHALEDRGAKVIYIPGDDAIFKTLLKLFRAVKPIGKRMIINPENNKETETMIFKCYIGSSKFNIQEMNDLLDTVLRYCNELGIDTEEYRYE